MGSMKDIQIWSFDQEKMGSQLLMLGHIAFVVARSLPLFLHMCWALQKVTKGVVGWLWHHGWLDVKLQYFASHSTFNGHVYNYTYMYVHVMIHQEPSRVQATVPLAGCISNKEFQLCIPVLVLD